jgi:hypothetical protein
MAPEVNAGLIVAGIGYMTARCAQVGHYQILLKMPAPEQAQDTTGKGLDDCPAK